MSTSSVQALAERKNRQVRKHLNIRLSIKENTRLDIWNFTMLTCVSCDCAEALCMPSLEGGWQVWGKSSHLAADCPSTTVTRWAFGDFKLTFICILMGQSPFVSPVGRAWGQRAPPGIP